MFVRLDHSIINVVMSGAVITRNSATLGSGIYVVSRDYTSIVSSFITENVGGVALVGPTNGALSVANVTLSCNRSPSGNAAAATYVQFEEIVEVDGPNYTTSLVYVGGSTIFNNYIYNNYKYAVWLPGNSTGWTVSPHQDPRECPGAPALCSLSCLNSSCCVEPGSFVPTDCTPTESSATVEASTCSPGTSSGSSDTGTSEAVTTNTTHSSSGGSGSGGSSTASPSTSTSASTSSSSSTTTATGPSSSSGSNDSATNDSNGSTSAMSSSDNTLSTSQASSQPPTTSSATSTVENSAPSTTTSSSGNSLVGQGVVDDGGGGSGERVNLGLVVGIALAGGAAGACICLCLVGVAVLIRQHSAAPVSSVELGESIERIPSHGANGVTHPDAESHAHNQPNTGENSRIVELNAILDPMAGRGDGGVVE